MCYVCSLCRDAVSDLALHFLAKMKIMVVSDIEREDIEFICKVRLSVIVCRLVYAVSRHHFGNHKCMVVIFAWNVVKVMRSKLTQQMSTARKQCNYFTL